MKKFFAVLSAASLIMIAQPAFAEDQQDDGRGTWAVIGEDGAIENIIVCDNENCGGGTWEGKEVVKQTDEDPETNNNAGFMDNTTYDRDTGQFFVVNPDNGATYQIPENSTGKAEELNCIENCPPAPCDAWGSSECWKYPGYSEESVEAQQEEVGPTASEETVESQEETENVEILAKQNLFVVNNIEESSEKNTKIKIFLNKKVKKVYVVAKKWEGDNVKKKSWTIKKKSPSKMFVFNVPKEYESWKIVVKNKKNIVNKVTATTV